MGSQRDFFHDLSLTYQLVSTDISNNYGLVQAVFDKSEGGMPEFLVFGTPTLVYKNSRKLKTEIEEAKKIAKFNLELGLRAISASDFKLRFPTTGRNLYGFFISGEPSNNNFFDVPFSVGTRENRSYTINFWYDDYGKIKKLRVERSHISNPQFIPEFEVELSEDKVTSLHRSRSIDTLLVAGVWQGVIDSEASLHKKQEENFHSGYLSSSQLESFERLKDNRWLRKKLCSMKDSDYDE